MAPKVVIAVDELREGAAEARDLASALKNPSAATDLLKYASALEADAARWEGAMTATTSKRQPRGCAESLNGESGAGMTPAPNSPTLGVFEASSKRD